MPAKTVLSNLWRRFRALRHSDETHAELTEEFQFQIDMTAAELMLHGIPEDDARKARFAADRSPVGRQRRCAAGCRSRNVGPAGSIAKHIRFTIVDHSKVRYRAMAALETVAKK